MLNALKRWLTKPVQPLENPKSAEKWLNQQQTTANGLPAAVIAMIEQALQGRALANAPALQALLYLDAQLQTPMQMLAHQYLSNPRMSRSIQERIWHDVVGLAGALVNAYQRFIQSGGELEDDPEIEKALPLISGRTMRYLAITAKWHYFRMEAPPTSLWIRAHQLYRLAEVKGFDSDPITLYPGSGFLPTTCADEYLQLLLLETVNSGNLLPRQIDLVDQWLNKWTHSLTLERQYQPDKHLYAVNLTEAEGVSRAGEEMVGDMCRYLSMQMVASQIAAAIRGLENGESPAKLDLGAEARSPGSIEVLRQLQNVWSMQRDHAFKRASERRQVKRLVDVIHGVSDLYTAVRIATEHQKHLDEYREGVDYDELVDMKLYGFVSSRTKQKLAQSVYNQLQHTAVEVESWTLQNESEGGYGAVLPMLDNDWVRIGSLIGLRDHKGNDDPWQIGVVRRLTKVNSEQLYAGVQILGYTAVAVQQQGLNKQRSLNLSVSGMPDLSGMTEKTGLLLVAEGKPSGLLLQTADYASDKLVKLVSRSRILTVKFKEVKEKGIDWSWAMIEVVDSVAS